MKKIFDIYAEAFNHCIGDAKWKKDHEVWTYNIEHKEMKDGKQYRIVIYELEDIEDIGEIIIHEK